MISDKEIKQKYKSSSLEEFCRWIVDKEISDKGIKIAIRIELDRTVRIVIFALFFLITVYLVRQWL